MEHSQYAELLKTLEADVARYSKMFKDATQAIIQQGVSNYPIFVPYTTQPVLGIPLLSKEQSNTFWSYTASTLEEFVSKQVILIENVESFKAIYKNPKMFLCLFFLNETQGQFIFCPLS